MKLSTKIRYGTRLMIDIAANSSQGPVLLGDISKRQRISEKYLWNLAAPLKAAGYITAQRGVKGGYSLTREAEGITVKDIVTVLEGPVALVDAKESKKDGAVTADIWNRASKEMEKVFSSYKLSDLAAQEVRMRPAAKPIMKGYAIFGV